MKAAVGVLAASAVFLGGVLTGFARDDGGGPAPGLVELGDEAPATAPSTTTTPTIATTATVPTVPTTQSTTPSTSPSPPPVTVDDDHEEVARDVDEGDLDDFDDNRGRGRGGDDDSGPGRGGDGGDDD